MDERTDLVEGVSDSSNHLVFFVNEAENGAFNSSALRLRRALPDLRADFLRVPVRPSRSSAASISALARPMLLMVKQEYPRSDGLAICSELCNVNERTKLNIFTSVIFLEGYAMVLDASDSPRKRLHRDSVFRSSVSDE